MVASWLHHGKRLIFSNTSVPGVSRISHHREFVYRYIPAKKLTSVVVATHRSKLWDAFNETPSLSRQQLMFNVILQGCQMRAPSLFWRLEWAERERTSVFDDFYPDQRHQLWVQVRNHFYARMMCRIHFYARMMCRDHFYARMMCRNHIYARMMCRNHIYARMMCRNHFYARMMCRNHFFTHRMCSQTFQ